MFQKPDPPSPGIEGGQDAIGEDAAISLILQAIPRRWIAQQRAEEGSHV